MEAERKSRQLLIFIIFVAISYFVLATGFSLNFAADKGYYGLLADAFMKFQTHLEVKPDPRLLKLPDPYEPSLNAPYRLHDASLFHGRYYLYWGPVPALVRILFLNELPEQSFILFYTLGCTFVSFLILLRIVTYLSKKYSEFLLYLSFIIIGFNGIVLSLLASKGIYYEAIAAGQLFFLLGIYFTIIFLINKKYMTLFLSTLFFSLSLGSRISYILPVSAVIFLLVVYKTIECFKRHEKVVPHLKKLILASTPLISILTLLAFYNYNRFGSITEFGMNFQLAGINIPKNKRLLVNIQNIPINLRNYLFNMPHFSSRFPFISLNPKYYSNVERIVLSIFALSPLTLILLFKKPSGFFYKKIYIIFIISILLILLFVSYFTFLSATRYIFDYIYLTNILSATLILLNTKTNKDRVFHKSYILLAALITILLGVIMWINAIAEYDSPLYFNLTKLFLYIF